LSAFTDERTLEHIIHQHAERKARAIPLAKQGEEEEK
jgi:hypothetical protein